MRDTGEQLQVDYYVSKAELADLTRSSRLGIDTCVSGYLLAAFASERPAS
jgi:hypothetical protein